jgi:methionine biosynthesis protein MetW
MDEASLRASALYNSYWDSMDRERAMARSRERAETSLELLESLDASEGRLLDVGSGPGWALEVFAREGLAATGLEVSARGVDEARQRGLEVHQVDIEATSSEEILEALGGAFDLVVAFEVLEHLHHPLETLHKLLRLTKPDGKLVVSLPNEIHLLARLQILLGRLPFGGHDDPHVRHFDLRKVRSFLEAAPCRVLGRRYVNLVPPRWPRLRSVLAPLVPLFPGLLSLSVITVLGGLEDA